jgi:hypothetical protein
MFFCWQTIAPLVLMDQDPSNKSEEIHIEVREDAVVQIYDVSNLLFHEQLLRKGKTSLNLRDKNLSSGIYYAVIRTNNQVYTSKIILSN